MIVALIRQVDQIGQELSNFPAVALLATSGVIGLIFILRWMVKFQREFTNFYIDENNKLRGRIEDLEAEAISKTAEITAAARELLKYEREADARMRVLERTIDTHEMTIATHQATITALEDRLSGATG